MISVIVPAYNACSTIGECLGALARQVDVRTDYEVIVVDDGSVDDTAEVATMMNARVIRQPHLRAAAARNAGLKAAHGDVVCFTDADCAPSSNWLYEITKPLDDENIVGCKGVYKTNQSELIARFVQLEYEDKYDRMRNQPLIDFIDTYSAAYRRDVLLANGAFDPSIRYVEDQELSFRLASRGYKMVFREAATVLHKHSDSLGAYIRKKYNIGYWKTRVISRYPNRGISDSHTPQVMKLQIILAAAALSLIVLVPWWRPAAWLFALAAAAHFGSTIPFLVKAWKIDRQVALASPGLLFARSVSLGFGWTIGMLAPAPKVSRDIVPMDGLSLLSKRALDLFGALVGLVVALIIGPWIWLAIKLTSSGPLIFKQRRIGIGGQPFFIYKFRTMRQGADKELPDLVDIKALDQPVFKLHQDPRVTLVGRFLRRWSLDELPQFWNVLIGQMSLVGPRPEEEDIVQLYSDRQRRRLAAKPGITGPMQIGGRGDLNLEQRLELELEYIDNYSFWRDLKILILTIPAVLKGRGAR